MKLLLTFLAAIVCQLSPAQDKDQLASLEGAIEQFNDAFKDGDVETLSKMIPDNYVHTNGSWKSFGKETWLGYMSERRKKIDQGELFVSSYEMSESQIELHENVAILTARISTLGTEDGKDFKKSFRITNVWVKRQGNWLRAAFHDTPI